MLVAVPVLMAAMTGTRAHAVPILNQSNGHYYDVVDGNFSWEAANLAANSSSYMGLSGHLVTITSASENAFLTDNFGASGLQLHWTGGIQPAGTVEPGGGWSWVTGEAFTFSNWAPGEANNTNGEEDNLEFWWADQSNSNGAIWNDLSSGNMSYISGYVVEFEAILVHAPEPSSLALAGIGIVLLAAHGLHRRRRAVV
jgi:hypothetical protein